MEIKRIALQEMKKALRPQKVLVVYGPRRIGKTTLLQQFHEELQLTKQVKFVNGEESITQEAFSVQTEQGLRRAIGGAEIVIIDEAQYIPNVGINLKIIVDHISGISVIASGSASFDLVNTMGEPLVGRKRTVKVFPLSAREIIENWDYLYYREKLEEHLIFGGYPAVFSFLAYEEKQKYLQEILNDYLLKDILMLEGIRGSKLLIDLLTLLAYQIGQEVSLSELGRALGISRQLVARYLDLFEKAFILVNIRGFSRSLRSEVTKTSRYYFYDNGIRNALINNFNPLSRRNDVGALWENYLVMERLKKQAYDPIFANNYFWRTYDQKEIDWVEERDGKYYGFEVKWNDKKSKSKPPKLWLDTYENAEYQEVNRENFLDFIV